MPSYLLTDGQDYNKTDFSLFYEDGPCTQYFKVPIINDEWEEHPENFTIKLKIPEKADDQCVFLGSHDITTVEIIDVG